MYEFHMPALGADMEAGTLVEWMVKPGDAVRRGQAVAVVETQKGAIEVEIWQDGVIDRLTVAPGMRVPVGEVLALVRTESAQAPPGEPAAAAVFTPPPEPVVVTRPPLAESATGKDAVRVRVSPSARKRAAELGVDLALVQPSAPGAPVSLADVERVHAAAGAGAAGALAQAVDWRSRMRAAIAAAMSRSKREIPHYYLATDIDVTRLDAWLSAGNLRRPVAGRVLPVVPLMKAVALALHTVPELNGVWAGGTFQPSARVHLGMAVAMRGGGLVAPAIHDADRKSLDELMADLSDLVLRVRGGRLRSSEMTDPTVTLTSLGDLGVDEVVGVIYPPQGAIIGLGSVSERPWVDQGALVVRKVMTATLSADHRVSDGHRGALFLAELRRLVQEPESLG